MIMGGLEQVYTALASILFLWYNMRNRITFSRPYNAVTKTLMCVLARRFLFSGICQGE